MNKLKLDVINFMLYYIEIICEDSSICKKWAVPIINMLSTVSLICNVPLIPVHYVVFKINELNNKFIEIIWRQNGMSLER
jgi:hypothetical protein